jgi:hypothetical protein
MDFETHRRRARRVSTETNHSAPDHHPVDQWTRMERAVGALAEKYDSYKTDPNQWMAEFDHVQELSHDARYGSELAANTALVLKNSKTVRTLDLLIELMKHESIAVRQRAALTFGSMVENNDHAQRLVNEYQRYQDHQHELFYSILLRVVHDTLVRADWMFAFANFVRGNSEAYARLVRELPSAVFSEIKSNLDKKLLGLQDSQSAPTPLDVLASMFQEPASVPKLKRRITQFIADFYTSVFYRENGHLADESHNDWWWHPRSLHSTQLWCSLAQSTVLLSSSQIDKVSGNERSDQYALLEASLEAIRRIQGVAEHDKKTLCTFSLEFKEWAENIGKSENAYFDKAIVKELHLDRK